MNEDGDALWLTLDLDPGTAAFFGLPSRLSIPETGEAPLLVDDPPSASLDRLAEGLQRTIDLRPADPDRGALIRFVQRWPRYADLDRYLRMGNATFARAVTTQLLSDDPQDPPALAARALLEAREKNWDHAVQLFETLRGRAPTHAQSRLQHALCLAGAGRREEAAGHLDDLTRHPRLQSLARFWRYELVHNPSLDEALSRVWESTMGIQETEAPWARLESSFPDNPEVQFARALRLHGPETEAEREAGLRRVLEADPGHVAAAAMLAALLQSRGEPVAGLEVLDASLGSNPDHPVLRGARGQVLEQMGERDAARDDYEAVFSGALALLPGPALLGAGLGLIRLGAEGQARRHLEDAVEARPGDPLPHPLLARLDESTPGGREAAERRLRDAVRSCGPVPLLQYSLGDLLRRSGRSTEAEGVFKMLVRRHPRSPWGYRGRGDLLVETKPAEAVEHYAEALKRTPDLPIPGYDYLLGVAALRSGDLEDARRRLQRAVAAEPDNARYWCDLGAVLFYLGNEPGAFAATGRALELQPGHPGFLHNLAEFHRARFRRNPLLHFRSGWTAWRLRRQVVRATESGWRRDLWTPPEKEDDADS